MNQTSESTNTRTRPRAKVLVLDDEWSTLERLKTLLKDKYQVSVASRAREATSLMDNEHFDVVLSDVRMPEVDGLTLVSELKERHPLTQYILMTAFSEIDDTINAIRVGVADYLRKPFTEGEVLHALSRCLERRRLVEEVAILRGDTKRAMPGLISDDAGMRDLCSTALNVAGTDASILISGETGTGKGLLARAIHDASQRRDKPFVEIDCASIPAPLIESELFGHERGAFTGAISRKLGKVETGEGGTVVLDEVGEMPLEVQPKLLRFLQHFTFERVGGTTQLQADVRVIAATNRDLGQEVCDGRFRQDLFYRLHVISLSLPPLRDRGDDVLLLADHFREKFAKKYNRPVHGISLEAQAQLKSHHWPGNVRELEHALERAVILCEGHILEKLDLNSFKPVDRSTGLGAHPSEEAVSKYHADIAGKSLKDYVAECEHHYLSEMLNLHEGSIGKTAKAAGLNPKTLYLKMGRHSLYRQDFKKIAGKKQN